MGKWTGQDIAEAQSTAAEMAEVLLPSPASDGYVLPYLWEDYLIELLCNDVHPDIAIQCTVQKYHKRDCMGGRGIGRDIPDSYKKVRAYYSGT